MILARIICWAKGHKWYAFLESADNIRWLLTDSLKTDRICLRCGKIERRRSAKSEPKPQSESAIHWVPGWQYDSKFDVDGRLAYEKEYMKNPADFLEKCENCGSILKSQSKEGVTVNAPENPFIVLYCHTCGLVKKEAKKT